MTGRISSGAAGPRFTVRGKQLSGSGPAHASMERDNLSFESLGCEEDHVGPSENDPTEERVCAKAHQKDRYKMPRVTLDSAKEVSTGDR